MHDVNLDISGLAVSPYRENVRKASGMPPASPCSSSAENLSRLPVTPDGDVTSVQVLRTLPGGSIKRINPSDEDLPYGETGILEAYERAIANAQRHLHREPILHPLTKSSMRSSRG